MKVDNKPSFRKRFILNYNIKLDSEEDKYTRNIKICYYLLLIDLIHIVKLL